MPSGTISVLSLAGSRGRSFVPGAAVAAGLSARYRYWCGRSGRAYLFTRIERETLADFSDALVLLAEGGRVVWVGEAAALGAAPVIEAGAACYVHLLAPERDQRRLIARDLGGAADNANDGRSNVTAFRSAA